MRIGLAPIDYYFFRPKLYTIQFIFEYADKVDPKRFSEAVQTLAKLLPIITSSLVVVSDQELALETEGEIVVRYQYSEFDYDMLSMRAIEAVADNLIDSVENKNGAALVKILVTETTTRTFIGFSFSHILGDGVSFFYFLDCLSQLCLAKMVSINCSTKRSVLSSPDVEPADMQSGLTPRELFAATGYVIPRPPAPAATKVEIFRYNKSDLKNDHGISANDFIMADLVKRSVRSIPLEDGKVIVRCPVNYRNILPQLSTGYFGNAVKDALAFFTPEELSRLTIYEIAQRIRRSILAVDPKAVERSLTTLDLLRKKRGHGVFAQMDCPGLLVSNLSKFPIRSLDFGSGPPIGFHHTSLNPRLAVILPTAQGFEVHAKMPLPNEAAVT